ncbi:glycosyltransferase family 4 protein [Prolixibacter sp. NT017]|uniref:glycosyltransferase family 4 protein n=1 Tax=Prolixibacter sp. NT017 TaxID=2652390 RepID=UPI001298F393|nr:glycosyltransferase family 4 protein [Prolixibacter sp. NT017]
MKRNSLNKMKILSLANKVPFPRKDGGAIGILNILEGYADNGHQVTLLAMNTPKHHIRENELPTDLTSKIRFLLVDVNTNIKVLSLLVNWAFSLKAYILERFVSPPFEKQLIKLLQGESFDFVQLEGLYLCPYIPSIRQNSDARIILREHNVEHEIWERTAEVEKGFKRFYLKNMAKRLRKAEIGFLNQYDILSTVTDRDKEKLNRLGNRQPAIVMQPGFAIETKPASELTGPLSIGFLGALDWIPNQIGLKWFVENCWPQIHSAHPDIQFLVAGRNAPEDLVEFLKKPGIVFLGEIEDAHDFISSRSILIVPLLSGSGVRVKILEGLTMGKAIVTTSIGAEGIPVQSGKELIVADAPEAFAKAVIQLINNPDRIQQLGHEAFRLASEHYRYDKAVIPFLQFLEKEEEVRHA